MTEITLQVVVPTFKMNAMSNVWEVSFLLF